jgi:hypothetical protein
VYIALLGLLICILGDGVLYPGHLVDLIPVGCALFYIALMSSKIYPG